MIIAVQETGQELTIALAIPCSEIEKTDGFDIEMKLKRLFCTAVEEYLTKRFGRPQAVDFEKFKRVFNYLGEIPVIDENGLHWEYQARFKMINRIQKQTSASKETTLNKHKKTQTT